MRYWVGCLFLFVSSPGFAGAKKVKLDPNLFRCGVIERFEPERLKKGPFCKKQVSTRPPLTAATQLTVDDLNAMARDLRPLVERESGVQFEQFPAVRLGTKEALQKALRHDSELVVRNLYDAPEAVLESMIESSAYGYRGILGKYDLEKKDLMLSLEAISSVLIRSSLKPNQVQAAVCLILAHEMAHALQGQEADLRTQITSMRDMDAFDAFRGVGEGHATFVGGQVARALELEDVFWELNEASQGWNREGLLDPNGEGFEVYALYGRGMFFIEEFMKQGGLDNTWRPVVEPPATTTMLFRPESYSSQYAINDKYASVLVGVEQKLTKGDWAVINSHLGEYTLRTDTAGLDEDSVNEVLGHLVNAHRLEAMRPDRKADIRILDFDETDAPKRYLELLMAGQEAMAKARSSAARQWTVTVKPYDAINGDAVVRRVIAPLGAHASAIETQSVWVLRGQRLVVVNVHGFRPGLRMNWTLEEVFTRLDSIQP